jgi:glycosyltransferase involved in cell wall biosynthesis
MTMQISVVIGTYNRAPLLAGTLRALAAQRVPAALAWEIVIVDNNSHDMTARLVADFSRTTAIPVRYVFEPRQGLTHARNRGIREARGSIIAFTDDDVLPAPDWIAQIPAAMERWNADGVGGRILPRWEEASPPRWLAENPHLMSRLAIMDSEASRLLALQLGEQPKVWGANMAFRREVFERAGGFDPRRGIVGDKLFRGEETDLVNRALGLGLTIAYDAALTVFHRIGPDRMRKGYFRKLIFDDAEGEARSTSAASGRSLLGAPLWLYRAAFTGFWKWLGLLLLGRPGAFDQQLDWLWSVGRLTGYWRAGLGRRSGGEPES